MKPLIRYTIGKVSNAGWDILFESIRMIKKVYPEFDIVICHNHLNDSEIRRLSVFDVELINQDLLNKSFLFADDDEGKVRNFSWKLMPPRLRINAHELWVDNDIIIRDRLPTLDSWLNLETSIISKGFNRDYGRFTELEILQSQPACCAGFFGLPPKFDFEKEILKLSNNLPLVGFDEQGLVSLVVCGFEDYLMVPGWELVLLSETWKPKSDFWSPRGIHFARSNRFDNHVAWNLYKKVIMP